MPVEFWLQFRSKMEEGESRARLRRFFARLAGQVAARANLSFGIMSRLETRALAQARLTRHSVQADTRCPRFALSAAANHTGARHPSSLAVPLLPGRYVNSQGCTKSPTWSDCPFFSAALNSRRGRKAYPSPMLPLARAARLPEPGSRPCWGPCCRVFRLELLFREGARRRRASQPPNSPLWDVVSLPAPRRETVAATRKMAGLPLHIGRGTVPCSRQCGRTAQPTAHHSAPPVHGNPRRRRFASRAEFARQMGSHEYANRRGFVCR
jgi:hypothetical protein